MYPSPGAWDPLFNAARVNPTLTFQAVINPNNGPDGGCPGPNYIHATSILSSITNIKTLAYVHTAARYNCGNWPTNKCTTNNAKDIHTDGIFFDETPTVKANAMYVQSITSFAKSTLTRYNVVLFNAGSAVTALIETSPTTSTSSKTWRLRTMPPTSVL
ncbi:Spherulation-specific family 4 [Cryomyces antarcticus]|nr:hypothetical protein LTR39_002046 [Cryomyces antarcticus]